MKTISARQAKNAFGLMIGTACAEQVLIGKREHSVLMVPAMEADGRVSAAPRKSSPSTSPCPPRR